MGALARIGRHIVSERLADHPYNVPIRSPAWRKHVAIIPLGMLRSRNFLLISGYNLHLGTYIHAL
jgi:hypothetical protein